MRIVLVGAVNFTLHCFEAIRRGGGDIVGVVTLARELAGRHTDFADLAAAAEGAGIPAFRVQRVNDAASVAAIAALRPDVIFVFGWSEILSPEVLALPRLGCIGSHPALLPQHRGRHPLVWALVEGLTESGLTFFYMDEGADSGDILWQKPFPITLDDDAATLYRKMEGLAAEAIADFVPQLREGRAPRVPQDHARATYWRKRTEKDGEIQWGAVTLQTYNLVRALSRPYPGAHTWLGDHRVRVWSAHLPLQSAADVGAAQPPGTVLAATPDGFMVRTGDGCLEIIEHDVQGTARLAVGALLGGSA